MNPAVAILGDNLDAELKRAFQELATVLQLRAEFSLEANLSGVSAVVCVGNLPVHLPSVPRFQFVSSQPTVSKNTTGTLVFADHPALPAILRGQSVELGKESGWGNLDAIPGGEVLASINGQPVWKIKAFQGFPVWSVSTPLPLLRPNTRLAHFLNGETFLPLLPLYLFLRLVSPESRWQPPPLRACLVVDDPNLHAPTYGHIRFKDLVQLAQEQPFHAAMATIPIDTWWTSTRAAHIFRENPQSLSLLVHGNDHVQHELAQSFPNGERDTLVAQSLTRIQAWENKKDVWVDKVMAPPHGVCAPGMFAALHAGGYEGMTTNRWSLWRDNPPESLPVNFGLQPADMLADLPVLNRFRFKSPIRTGEFLMAALLGQPIIPYGHHQDFAEDMTHVRQTLKTVNSLPVRWMSLRKILEGNFEHYLDSNTLHLRMFSRRVKVKLLPDIQAIQIWPLPGQNDESQKYEVIWLNKKIIVPAKTRVCELPSSVELEIRTVGALPDAKSARHLSRTSPTVVLRRLAAETRDRLKF